MLTEQRYAKILKLLDQQNSVTVAELTRLLDASESTVRRDITALDKAGRLTKVFGGAVSNRQSFAHYEPTVAQKQELYRKEKQQIARYAATLIGPEDFVYLDAGTTTGMILDYLPENGATFVTNAVAHAQKLAGRGFEVHLIGGILKTSTEAVIGSQAILTLQTYHFTKGFFGANGITRQAGFTTPEAQEALVKKTALVQCAQRYVLSDHSKFGATSSVTFAALEDALVLTDEAADGYEVIVCKS